MKKILLLLFTVLSLSCSNDEEINSDKKDDKFILEFEDENDFKKTIDFLVKDINEKTILNWSKKNNPNSLLIEEFKTGKIDNNQSLVMKALLNKNKILKISNKFIIYKNNCFYELANEHSKTSKNNIIGYVENKNVDIKELNNTNRNMQSSDVYKVWQEYNREFYQIGCGTPFQKSLKYRLVHELKSIKTVIYNSAMSELSMNFRISYKGSDWNDANDTERILNFSLSGSAVGVSGSYQTVTGYIPININGNFTCSNPAKGNKRYVIGSMTFFYNLGSDPSWNVNIQGNIFHQVNGDYNNQYQTYINW